MAADFTGKTALITGAGEQRVSHQLPFAFIPMVHDGAHESASHPMMKLTVVRGNRAANAKATTG